MELPLHRGKKEREPHPGPPRRGGSEKLEVQIYKNIVNNKKFMLTVIFWMIIRSMNSTA